MDIAFTQWIPAGFPQWLPFNQAAAVAISTLVQEDIPTIGAALLAAAGVVGWKTAWLGGFLGIWIGDALLYLAARGVGRPLLRKPWMARFASESAVRRSEAWFAARGAMLLVTSRFVPGTRLPTYLAAGFLRLHFGRFLAITGLAVGCWTSLLFLLVHVFGQVVGERFQQWGHTVWIGLVVAVGLAVMARLGLRAAGRVSFRALRAGVARWTRWEFWPAWLFYIPVAARYLQLSIRYRGLTLPCAANPSILHGGMVGESKLATLEELFRTSPEFTAEAWRIPVGRAGERFELFSRLLRDHGVNYPCILKPDIGQRGVGVKLIRSEADAKECIAASASDLVLQRYVAGPCEAGIFYYRFPGEAHGRIFAITDKIFPCITGDGIHTVEELIWKDDRARCLAARYLERFEGRRGEILAAGETLRLVEAGNHAQGCVFVDGARLITPELTSCIDAISRRLDGFYIGRYDVRYASEEELRSGQGFQILELNGAAAEATSIYDARNSLRSAYRTLFRQWELVFAIGAANRERGHRPSAPIALWRTWRKAVRQIAAYPVAD